MKAEDVERVRTLARQYKDAASHYQHQSQPPLARELQVSRELAEKARSLEAVLEHACKI